MPTSTTRSSSCNKDRYVGICNCFTLFFWLTVFLSFAIMSSFGVTSHKAQGFSIVATNEGLAEPTSDDK